MAILRDLRGLENNYTEEILKDFPDGYSIHVVDEEEGFFIRLAYNYDGVCMIDYFPNNCSWIVVGGFNPSYRSHLKTCLAIADEIAKHLFYKVIFISDILGSPNLQIGKEAGYTKLLQNINYHSDNEVVLMAKELDYLEKDYI